MCVWLRSDCNGNAFTSSWERCDPAMDGLHWLSRIHLVSIEPHTKECHTKKHPETPNQQENLWFYLPIQINWCWAQIDVQTKNTAVTLLQRKEAKCKANGMKTKRLATTCQTWTHILGRDGFREMHTRPSTSLGNISWYAKHLEVRVFVGVLLFPTMFN